MLFQGHVFFLFSSALEFIFLNLLFFSSLLLFLFPNPKINKNSPTAASGSAG